MTDIAFLPAIRMGTLATSAAEGRALRTATFHLGAGGSSGEVALRFVTPGPRDVRGLRPGAIRRVAPAPGTWDAEETHRPFVEFTAEDLPWRYSPGDEGGHPLPWLALVVGTDDELMVSGGTAVLGPAAQTAHPLAGNIRRWAHVQRDPAGQAGGGVSRVLCCRTAFPAGERFPANTPLVAALVVPDAVNGTPTWPVDGRVPCLHSWRFRTGEPGDFAELARALRKADDDALGTVAVFLPGAADALKVPGALTTIRPGPVLGPLPDGPARDHDVSTTEQGVVGPPAYGQPWAAAVGDDVEAARITDEATWAWTAQVNADLRHRVAAGVGRQAGMDLQEEIAAAAARVWRFGAMASGAVNSLALGSAAAGSLFSRVPARPELRLHLLGPAAGNVVVQRGAGQGTLRGALRHPDPGNAPYPVALLSPALGRALGPGRPAARFAAPGATATAAVVGAAGLADDEPPATDQDAGHLDGLLRAVENLFGTDARESVAGMARELPIVPEEPRRPTPLHLETVADLLTGLVDPTHPHSPARRRVLDRIEGHDRELAPVEDCPDLDLPAWRYLRDRAPHWLLPGADTLSDGEIVALRSNPGFAEAFLLGLNQQAVAELRWRQHPVRAGCTPLRRFWDRTPDVGGTRDDVSGISTWSDATGAALGRLGEHPGRGVTPERLVVVVRSELFRRYPRTLLSLAPFAPNGRADLAQREWPEFVAAMSEDLTIFAFATPPEVATARWVVIEEVPDGIRFALDGAAGGDSAHVAQSLVVRPVRVLLSGATLLGGGDA